MKKKGYSLLNSFRYICLICLLVLGFITIVGTGDGIEFGGDGRITMTLTANPISSTEIALSWTPDPHLKPHWYYGIHKNGTHFTSVDSDTTSITVSGLNPNTRYCFIVYSKPSLFLVSCRSNQACATTLPDYPPTTPANLVASAVSLIQIDLSWDASTDDYGVTGYKIYRDGTYLKSVTGTSTSDTGLNPDTNYCYTVSAYDAVGNESAPSNQACATTPPDETPPTSPINLVASAVSLIQIDLSWDASTDDVEVTGYKIYRDGTYLKSVTGTSTSDTGLNPDTNYCYTVSAYDAVGNESAPSNQACAITYTIITIDSEGDVGWYTSIALDSADNVHISYYDYTNDDLKYTTNASGAWVIATIDSEDHVGYDTSIALDSADNVHISYYDYTNGDLKYATNASGAWVIATIDSEGDVGMFTSIALDSADNVHISYRDSTNSDLKYATNASGAWVITTIDSEGFVGWYTSIAIDSLDNVHISYCDVTNSDLKYATNR